MRRPSTAVILAWARLMRAQQLVLRRIETDLKAADLPPLVWYDVLLELERADPDSMRPFELERAMLMAQYNLSRILSRMEEAGYLERRRCDDDGRGQVVAITKSGKAIRRKMWPIYAASIQAMVGERLREDQAVALAELLKSLLDTPRA